MRKFTFRWLLSLLVMTGFAFSANADVCTQTFTASGQDDDPTTVNIVPSDLTCTGGGTINSITLVNTAGSFTNSNCGGWYDFTLIVDGSTIIANGCQADFDNTSIAAGFSTIEVHSNDLDAYSDGVTVTFDLEIDYTPASCPAPGGLTASNITANSATLSWVIGNTETAWNVEYGTTGFTQGTGTSVAATDTFTNVTSLIASTDYDFYVQADCGGDQSTWTGPFTFTTECDVVSSFPYAEDFETTNSTPDCWGETRTPASTYGWASNTSGYDNNCFRFDSYLNSSGNISVLNTVAFDFSAETALELKFWWKNPTGGNFKVMLSTDGGATFPNTLADNLTSVSAYEEKIIDLTSYCGAGNNNIVIGFEGTSNYGSGDAYIYLDKLSIQTPPACHAPSDLAATPADVSANLSWNGYTATNWDIEWGVTGFTPTGTPTINDTPNNPENISGLTPQTAYDFYVRADCGSDNIDTSIWVGPFTFTTECSPITAPFTEDFENAGAIPSCWKQGTTNSEDWMFDNDVTNPGHVGNAGNVGGTTSASGGYFAWVDDSSPNNIGTTMESPLIDLSALTVPALSFYMISNNEGSENAELQVDVWDGSTWTNVFTNKANTNNWELKIADLSAFSGTIKLRFVVNEDAAGNWYDDIAIDDISVREISSETDILTYSFPEQTGAATIDAAAHTVNIEVGNGTDLTTLIADFTLSTGATAAIGGVAQVSGTTANDFSGGSLTYDVTAEDGTTTQAWTVTVTEAPINTETDILTYSFPEQTGDATIDATAHTVNIEVNACADLTNLVSSFTLSYGANAAIGGTAQVSGTTANDFSAPVTYDVTAEDGTTVQAWTVTVTQAAAPAEVSCSTPAAYTINGADYTNTLCSSTPLYVEVTLDQDYTNVRFETCGSDFDTKLAYFANCTDITDDMTTSPSNPTNNLGYNDDDCGVQSGIDVATLSAGTYIACLYGYGTASGNIQFRVTGTPASDAEILSYTIPNQVSSDIFAANDSISVLMPQGTDVTALIADFTLSTNATVTVATVAQVSGTTPNDWTTNPVDYLVTGEDGITTRTWHVWVTTNVGINNIIDSKDVTVYPNPNNGQFNIALNLNVNKVNMEVVNALGQVVAKFNDIDASSTQTISLDQVAEGMYYIRISSENNTIIKKVNVIK